MARVFMVMRAEWADRNCIISIMSWRLLRENRSSWPRINALRIYPEAMRSVF